MTISEAVAMGKKFKDVYNRDYEHVLMYNAQGGTRHIFKFVNLNNMLSIQFCNEEGHLLDYPYQSMLPQPSVHITPVTEDVEYRANIWREVATGKVFFGAIFRKSDFSPQPGNKEVELITTVEFTVKQ